MSPGDQLLTILIDTVGTILTAMINSFFATIITPMLEIIAEALGLPS